MSVLNVSISNMQFSLMCLMENYAIQNRPYCYSEMKSGNNYVWGWLENRVCFVVPIGISK